MDHLQAKEASMPILYNHQFLLLYEQQQVIERPKSFLNQFLIFLLNHCHSEQLTMLITINIYALTLGLNRGWTLKPSILHTIYYCLWNSNTVVEVHERRWTFSALMPQKYPILFSVNLNILYWTLTKRIILNNSL